MVIQQQKNLWKNLEESWTSVLLTYLKCHYSFTDCLEIQLSSENNRRLLIENLTDIRLKK